MAEQITLLDIRFNVAGATEDLKKLQEQSAQLSLKQAELKKSSSDLNKQMQDLNKAYADGAITADEYSSRQEDIAKEQAGLKQNTAALNAQIAENNQLTKASITALHSQENSVKAMRAELAKVSSEWANLTEEEINNTEKGQALSKRKRELTEDLKRLEAQTGDTRRNVGNYTDSILKASSAMQAGGGAVGGMAGKMSGSIGIIKTFNATLSANPIGAIITAVTVLINIIGSLVNNTSDSANKMDAAWQGIKVLIEKIGDVLGFVLGKVIDFASGVIEMAVKAASALGLISDESLKASEAAKKLKISEKELYEQETELIAASADRAERIKELLLIEADQTKSNEERAKAIADAIELTKQETEASAQLAKEKYEQIKAQNELTNSTIEDNRKQAEAYANYVRINTDGKAKLKELTSKQSSFEKQALAAEVAAQKEAEKERLRAVAERLKEEDRIEKDAHNDRVAKIKELNAQAMELERQRLADLQMMMDEEAAMYEEAMLLEEERMLTDIENQNAIREMQTMNQFELMRENLETQRTMELAEAERTGADKTLIEKKYSLERQLLNKQEADSRIALAGDTANQLASILGAESAAGKAAAVAAATINTYQGATKALATGGFLGIAQMAVVIAAGMAQVAKIVSTKIPDNKQKVTAKYAKGGKMAIFGGRRHSEGGTILRGSDGSVLEVEKGESAFVLNRSATSAIAGLSMLNEAHGGNSFYKGGLDYFQDGGMINLNTQRNTDLASDEFIAKLSNAIVLGVSQLPNPIVSVQDIDSALLEQKNIINIAST